MQAGGQSVHPQSKRVILDTDNKSWRRHTAVGDCSLIYYYLLLTLDDAVEGEGGHGEGRPDGGLDAGGGLLPLGGAGQGAVVPGRVRAEEVAQHL